MHRIEGSSPTVGTPAFFKETLRETTKFEMGKSVFREIEPKIGGNQP
jgi:hypothetical protein